MGIFSFQLGPLYIAALLLLGIGLGAGFTLAGMAARGVWTAFRNRRRSRRRFQRIITHATRDFR